MEDSQWKRELAALRSAVDQSFDGINLTDLEGRIVYANPASEALYGYEAAELAGRHVSVLNVDPEVTDATIIPAIKAQGYWEGELPQRRKDGHRFTVYLSASAVTVDGFPCGMLGIMRDVTGEREAEAARRRHEEELVRRNRFIEIILDNLPIGLAVNYIDEGSAVYINKKFEEIYGWTKEELEDIEHFFEKVYPDPGYRETIKARVHADLRSGDPKRMMWEGIEVTGRDGTKRVVDAKNIPIPEQNLMVSTVQDVTESKRLQAQLEQARKLEAIGRLAGGVAHDYNNMLGVILGYADLALGRLDAREPLAADLRAIQKAAERSADLTRQLLAFARKQPISPKVIDLNREIESAFKMLRRTIGENIRLEWRPGTGLWMVRMDPTQLGQILMNLCINARDAIADTGRIGIETENIPAGPARSRGHDLPPGDYVRLAVSDDGEGMSPDVLPHLFEPFFTSREVGQGTGLGLATVYGIVRQNDGHIFVRSEPGSGATFTIYLPRYRDLPAADEQQEPSGSALRGHESVLLVEDEPAVRDVLRNMLTALGYEVRVAGTPQEAIRIAREPAGEIDLLVTDVVMPEMNGRELAERLLRLHPSLKCVFISGYAADLVGHENPESGIHFVQKPFSVKSLARKLREALEKD